MSVGGGSRCVSRIGGLINGFTTVGKDGFIATHYSHAEQIPVRRAYYSGFGKRDGLEIARQAFDFPIAIAHRIRPAATIYLFLRAERGGGLSARGAALLCFSQGTFCRLAQGSLNHLRGIGRGLGRIVRLIGH